MVVRVYDDRGLNFEMKSKNALIIIKSLLHGIKRNYVVIDYTHSIDCDVDYIVYLQ